MKTNRLAFLIGCLFVTVSSFSQTIWTDFYYYSPSCGSKTLQFYDSTYSSAGTIVQWNWNFGDPASGANNTSSVQAPVHTFSNYGNYTVSLAVMDVMGNRDTMTKTVSVNVGPVLSYPPLPSVCISGGSVSVASATVTNGVAGYGYYSGPGVSGQGLFNPAIAGPGTHTIKYTFYVSGGGCADTVFQTITVVGKPVPAFNFSTSGCLPATVNFSNTSFGASTYQWSFGDGTASTAANPTHVYTMAGTFQVKLMASSATGCRDSLIRTLTVAGPPVASFQSYHYDSFCARKNVYFYSTSTNTFYYSWDFGDGNTSSAQYAYHNYASPGTYTVKLVASNDCSSDSTTQVVMISAENKTIKPAQPGTLSANRQCDSDNGWTNYYFDNNTPNNVDDDTLLLSLKLNGQYIGMLGDSVFHVTMSATAGAGSNTGLLLTNPLITNPTGYWVMNRYWNVQPRFQPTSPVGVRFYFNTQDLNDVNGSYPTHNLTYNDLIFYKTLGGNPDPTTNLAGATAINSILNGSVADTAHWVYTALAGNSHMAEFAVSHFSGGGGGGTGNHQSLPLRLVSFDAVKNGKTVVVQWKTVGEVNVRMFEVQKSSNGSEFSVIGSVAAINGQGQTYSFTDNALLTKTVYYRLKMIDNDGRFSYSTIREVTAKQGLDVVVYPNPVKDILSLNLNSETRQDARLEIVSLEGKVLQVVNTSFGTGETSKTVNVSALQAGNYYLRVKTNSETTVNKFMKL